METQATAEDRREDAVIISRLQDDERAGRRLLERLQESVGGFRLETVGLIDDDDAVR